jgi:hypothetical protein
MALLFILGTVQIEAIQMADEVHLKVKDKFGHANTVQVPGVQVDEIPFELVAGIHRRHSQFETRRN